MTQKEVLNVLDGFKFEVKVYPNEDPDTDEVRICFAGLTWYVWINPEWCEIQCYDLPDGGYDGYYVNSPDEVLERVLFDYLDYKVAQRAAKG